LDFEALRAQLEAQGQDLGHVKIGFHARTRRKSTGSAIARRFRQKN